MPEPPLVSIRRFADVRKGEGASLLWAFVLFFCVLCSYMILRPVREAMGIAAGVEHLQWLFTGTFVAMLLGVPVFSALVSKLGRRRFVPIVYHFFAANLVIFFLLLETLEGAGRQAVAWAFWIWISVFNLFVVSVFWGLMADLFREEQGRRLFGVIAVGGSAGALVGPALTAVLVARIGVPSLLLISFGLLEAGVFCLGRLLRSRAEATGAEEVSRRADEDPIGGGTMDGFRRVFSSPYLLGIAGYVLLMSLVGTFMYFEQARLVRDAIPGDGERTALFAKMDLAVNITAVLCQALVFHRLVRWLGLGKTLALMPLATVIGLVVLGLRFELWTLVVFQVIQRGTNFGVANPAREVLFTVVPREDKYKAKAFIDTVTLRGADVAFGWLFAGLVGVGLALPTIILSAVPAAALWTWLGHRLGRSAEARSTSEG